MPLIERLTELTPGHRVVTSCPSCSCRRCRAGTTVAVYTNVTSDHLDRHGTLGDYRRVKRRLAELVDPDGVVVLNAEDRSSRDTRGLGRRRGHVPRGTDRSPGGARRRRRLDRRGGVERLPLAGGGTAATGPGGRIMPTAELAIPGAHNVSNALAAIGAALCSASPRMRSAGGRRVRRGGAPARARRPDRRRPLRQRFAGDPPDAVVAALRAFEPPVVLIAGGRDKGIDLDALAAVVAERARPRS